jgi:hypothetical protein
VVVVVVCWGVGVGVVGVGGRLSVGELGCCGYECSILFVLFGLSLAMSGSQIVEAWSTLNSN